MTSYEKGFLFYSFMPDQCTTYFQWTVHDLPVHLWCPLLCISALIYMQNKTADFFRFT